MAQRDRAGSSANSRSTPNLTRDIRAVVEDLHALHGFLILDEDHKIGR